MKYEKYLPIGSVVILKEAQKRMMIIGFCCESENKETYDYAGCLYPEGVIAPDKTLLFNHDQIARIYCIGFKDEEEERFKEKLNEMLKKIKG